MSHRATNWAVQQRGLKPATKVVLWHLSDRHNPDYGCFPSQAQLAFDAEMSRSTLNEHLTILEREGRIRRERRIDPTTRRQMSTRYILGFEDDFPQEPCPESGLGIDPEPCPENAESRVRIPDTNPVIEPVTTTPAAETSIDEVEARCLETCGPGLPDDGRAAIVATSGVIGEWIEEGFDLQADIVPTIRERTARERKTPIRTWEYFTEAIRAARRRRLAQEQREPPVRENGGDADAGFDSARRMADWINTGQYIPPSAVSNTMRDELLARGLVSEAALRRLQIY